MIKRLTVKKLFGQDNANFDLCFQEDMNVLTGRNGCGKTTLLKLAWYMISGNLERVLAELDFETASVETNSFKLSVTPNKTQDFRKSGSWEFESKKEESLVGNLFGSTSGVYPGNLGSKVRSTSSRLPNLLSPPRRELDTLEKQITDMPEGSVFFPTFRRIEGGFSMSRSNQRYNDDDYFGVTTGKVEDAMKELSQRLSTGSHRLVASISTRDIIEMVTSHYAMTSQFINRDHTNLSKQVTAMISKYNLSESLENDSAKLAHLGAMLNRIQEVVTETSSHQENLLQPFTALGNLVTQIFQHKGIRIAPGIVLGETNAPIPSDVLSAGEKQMLSFVAYNAFTRDSVIFIDEPEISLHVDWQRILFSILESQGTNNQFIVATHSPFIYSKYVDKELMLGKDRGD